MKLNGKKNLSALKHGDGENVCTKVRISSRRLDRTA
jgi:hypothetical protein